MMDIKSITIIGTYSPKAIAAINRHRRRSGIKSGVNAAEKLIERGEKAYKQDQVNRANAT